MSERSWSAEGRLKAGCSQDWLPHKAGRHEQLVPMNPTVIAQADGEGHSAASQPRQREDPAQPLRKVFANHPAAPGETDPVPAQR